MFIVSKSRASFYHDHVHALCWPLVAAEHRVWGGVGKIVIQVKSVALPRRVVPARFNYCCTRALNNLHSPA